jgi:hypothetical protein
LILGPCRGEPNHYAGGSRYAWPVTWRKNLRQLERSFIAESELDRVTRESLRRAAERRAAKRRAERTIREGRSRFILLSVMLVATAVVVAFVMFRALYLILE